MSANLAVVVAGITVAVDGTIVGGCCGMGAGRGAGFGCCDCGCGSRLCGSGRVRHSLSGAVATASGHQAQAEHKTHRNDCKLFHGFTSCYSDYRLSIAFEIQIRQEKTTIFHEILKLPLLFFKIAI